MQCGIGADRQMQYRHVRCPSPKEFAKSVAKAAKAQADKDRAAFKKMEDDAEALAEATAKADAERKAFEDAKRKADAEKAKADANKK